MTDLTSLTPAEIDARWIEAVEPANVIFAQANARRTSANKYRTHGYRDRAEQYDAEADALYATARAQRDEAELPYRVEWLRRGGWTRAYLVPDGHIHKTTACQSLYPTTLIRWLPEQSGWPEEKIVEAAGMMACTFCYPSAPVEALRAAAEAEKRKDECPGSRTYEHDSSGARYASPRAHCNHCGQTVSLTRTGKLRAHKKALLDVAVAT